MSSSESLDTKVALLNERLKKIDALPSSEDIRKIIKEEIQDCQKLQALQCKHANGKNQDISFKFGAFVTGCVTVIVALAEGLKEYLKAKGVL